jgi:hypothetical protein
MSRSKSSQSCYQLGVCQARKPACQGCDSSFAPGSIQGPFKRLRFIRLRKHWRSVAAVLFVVLAMFALVAVFGFGLGYGGAHHG